jgi:hypothetical protein
MLGGYCQRSSGLELQGIQACAMTQTYTVALTFHYALSRLREESRNKWQETPRP